MFEDIDLAGPAKHTLYIFLAQIYFLVPRFIFYPQIIFHLMFRLEVLEDPGVVLWLLEVGEGDAGDEVDLLGQGLVLVVVLEVLGVQLVVLGVRGDGVVVVGAVKVVAAVRVPGIALEQLLTFKNIIIAQ